MSIVISEFLPNPTGKDTDGEFIELQNNGSAGINLSGWKIKDAANKAFAFPAGSEIGSGRYLSLPYSQTKISLNNNSEKLFLFDNQNNLIDQAEYDGAAAAGQSLIRQNGKFVFTIKPTPGKANIFQTASGKQQTANKNHEISAASDSSSLLTSTRGFWPENFLIDVSLSLILAALFIIVWKKLESIDPNAQIYPNSPDKPENIF